MSATTHDHGAGWGDIGQASDVEALTSAHAEGRERAEAGDLTRARTLLEDALATGELRLGRDNPRLAPIMVDLATIARNVGNLTEAQNQLRRAYGIIINTAGPDHPTALSVEGRLAAVCYRLGEPTDAYDWHIAEVGQVVLGADHPAVRGAQQRLAAASGAVAEPDPGPGIDLNGGWAPADYEPPESDHEYAGHTSTRYPSSGYPSSDYPSSDYLDDDEPGGYPGEPARDGGAPAGYPDRGHEAVRYPTGSYRAATYQPDYEGDPEDGYPAYTPSPREPGVYQRRDAGRAVVPAAGAGPRTYPEPLTATATEIQSEFSVQRPTKSHAGGIALVMTAGLAILAGAVVVAVQLFGPTPIRPGVTLPTGGVTSAASDPVPSTNGTPANPPTAVKLVDRGGSVVLSWTDPSAGKVPFIISGGRDGIAPSPMQSVPVGRTSVTIYGLNDQFDYCFVVAAVWSSENIEPSSRTCTHRLSTTGAPSVPITASTA